MKLIIFFKYSYVSYGKKYVKYENYFFNRTKIEANVRKISFVGLKQLRIILLVDTLHS